MPPHPASIEMDQLRRECDIRFQRRSGPGGQHRNKVETSVHLTHRPSGVQAAASERRQQAENLVVAWQRLRIQLALHVRKPWQQPSPTWSQHTAGGRVRIRERHPDFPTLLAEALDALAVFDWDHRAAATALQVSATQLLRMLQRQPHSFVLLNQQRQQQGLPPLKP